MDSLFESISIGFFDAGYISVNTNGQLLVSRRINGNHESGQFYLDLRGRPISFPVNPDARPSAAAFEWHRNNVFQR
ncbi:MAG TPA: hypothetical protein VNO21_13590 [Polyangiaceae bacterium]|nr:hypothetical protein [Polyangiaceae bacterium]